MSVGISCVAVEYVSIYTILTYRIPNKINISHVKRILVVIIEELQCLEYTASVRLQ